MKKYIKLLLVVSILVLSLAIFAGCQRNEQASEEKPEAEVPSESMAKGKITVAASPTPHAEILAQAKDILAEQGYELEIIEFSDYVQPNLVVDAGDVDANFFQHKPYLDNFNEENGTNLVSVAPIHYEPLAIYAGKSENLSDIPDGAAIAVPSDTTNEARALLLLEANGLIEIKEGAGLAATKNDIEKNPHNIEIIELEAAQVSRVIGEVDFVVLNGNYALSAGLNVSDALAKEEQYSDAAQVYANILVVKEGNEEREDVKALIEALKSDEVKQYIDETYNGAVVAID
ncbi:MULTISPECIES: MetQ/NlpA family ABC transporter substrate-binding protein [unclassified Sedimentibacter]|uniref:MetQ/NlpA family ABC transporter substrate-binding protein n=1 Tax=unclassified Sedimentibacter TaxID=2649220 RepID=UPI0027E142B8|nr:MetQ/NlpA family ABC transporter substrate-binding protein [Sedimentibacter sp. MB35-C1]WMJ77599.1 MetQ/NlpA family ABC transporter substrate-binding protein [Sedimentibacter sp. MB35-C1]